MGNVCYAIPACNEPITENKMATRPKHLSYHTFLTGHYSEIHLPGFLCVPQCRSCFLLVRGKFRPIFAACCRFFVSIPHLFSVSQSLKCDLDMSGEFIPIYVIGRSKKESKVSRSKLQFCLRKNKRASDKTASSGL